LVCILVVNDDGRLVTTPSIAVAPPTLWAALSIRSLLVSITTIHLGVSSIGKRRIWHRLVSVRGLGGRRSVLRRRSAVSRRSRLHRQHRAHARTRRARVRVRRSRISITRIRVAWARRGRVTGVRIRVAERRRRRVTRHLGVWNHGKSQGHLSSSIAQGREYKGERANDGGDG